MYIVNKKIVALILCILFLSMVTSAETIEFPLYVDNFVNFDRDFLIEQMTTHELGPSDFIINYRKNNTLMYITEDQKNLIVLKPLFGEILYVESLAQVLGKTTEFRRFADKVFVYIIGENNIFFSIAISSLYKIAQNHIHCRLILSDGREFILDTEAFTSLKMDREGQESWMSSFACTTHIPDPESITQLTFVMSINGTENQKEFEIDMPFVGSLK